MKNVLRLITVLSMAVSAFAADAPFVEAQKKKQEKEKEAEIKALPVAELKRDTPVDFAKEIYPFLKKNCIACHNSSKAKAKLVLEAPMFILKGSGNGPVVVPGNGEKSVLFLSAAHRTDEPMPPEGNKSKAVNLSPEELALLRLWIDQGAKGDGPRVATAPERWGAIGTGIVPINTVAFSPDGLWTFCGRGNRVQVYHTASGRLEAELVDPEITASHRDIVQSMAVNRRGVVATGGFQSLKFWRPVNRTVERELAVPGEVTALASGADGQWIAAGDAAGNVHLWKHGEWNIRTDKVHNGPVRALRITADAVVSGSDDKTVLRRLLSDPAKQKKWTLPQPVRDLEVVDAGKRLAVAVQDPVVRVFELEGTNTTAVLEFKGHDNPVKFLRRVDGAQILSAADNGQVKRWNTADAKETGNLAAGGALSGLALNQAGSWLATTGAGAPLRFWEIANNKMQGEVKEDRLIREELTDLDRRMKVAVKLKDHRTKQKAEEEKKKGEAEKKIEAGAKDVMAKQVAFLPHQVKYDEAAARLTKYRMEMVKVEPANKIELAQAKEQSAKAEADLNAKLEKAKKDYPGIEAANKKEVESAKAVFAKLEADKNAEKKQAGDALKKQEADVLAMLETARADAKKLESDQQVERAAKQKALAEMEAAQKKAAEAAQAAFKKLEADQIAGKQKAAEALKKLDSEIQSALEAARAELVKLEAEKKPELEAKKKAFAEFEAKNLKVVETARAAFTKLEADQNAEKQKAGDAMKKQEAEGLAALETARNEVKKLEDTRRTELEAKKKALAELETARKTEVEQAKKALLEKEKQIAAALKAASDQLKKFEAEKTAALKKSGEDLKKLEADTKAGIAKAKEDLKKKETELAARLKQSQDGLKKLDDEIKKIRAEYDKAFQASRGATFARESALRDARRHHEKWLEAGAALAGMESRVTQFENRKKELDKTLAEKPLKLGAAAASGGSLFAVAEDGRLRHWDLASRSPVGVISGVGTPTVLAGLGDGRLLAGYKEKTVKVLQTAPRWELVGTVTNFQDRVTALAFSPDGWTLAAASGVVSRNGTIDFWNVSDLVKIGELTDPHSDTVTGMAFGPFGKLLASGSTDRFVKVWRLRDFSFVHGFEGHTGYVHDVAWRSDGLLLASAGADHEIKIWDLEARKQKQTLKQNSKEVTAVEFLGDGDTVVTSAGDPSVSIGNQKLPEVKDFMYAVAVSSDGKWVAAGGENGELLIWNAGDKKLVHRMPPPAAVSEQAAVTP